VVVLPDGADADRTPDPEDARDAQRRVDCDAGRVGDAWRVAAQLAVE